MGLLNNFKRLSVLLLVAVLLYTAINLFSTPVKAVPPFIAFVQSAQNTSGVGDPNISATWPVPTTNDNLLIAIIYACDSGMTPAFATPIGWLEATSNTTATGGCFHRTSIFYWPLAPSQAATGDFLVGSPDGGASMIVAEYSGLDGPVDQVGSNSGVGTLITTGSTPMTTVPDELLIGSVGQTVANNLFTTPLNGFTIRTQTDNLNPGADATIGLLDNIVGSQGLYFTGATGLGGPWLGAIATFGATGGGGNTAPSFTAGPSDNGSSPNTPTPVASNVTFTATATDPEIDNYYLAICKTNGIMANNNAAPTCTGGDWSISPPTISGSETTVTFAAVDAGAQIWYAFVCDFNASSVCSASSQGTGDNGSPFYVNDAPSFVAAPSDNGSSVTTPTTVGNNVTFTVTADDPQFHGYYLAICKTNAIDPNPSAAPACPGGVWSVSSLTTSGAEASVNYLTTAPDVGNQTWYAFVCDHDTGSMCSAAAQGSGDDGSPFVVVAGGGNAAPSFTAGPSDGGSSVGTPTTVGNNVAFSTTATDANGDNYYLIICKTNFVTASNNAPPTCPGGNWAVSTSTVSGVQASKNYLTTGSDIGNQTWYAFVCDHDASSLCSASSQGSGDNGSPFVVTAGANGAPSLIAGPSDGGSSAGAPTTVGNNVAFTLTATDPQSDNYYMAICKVNSITPNPNTAPTCGSSNPSDAWKVIGPFTSGSQASGNYTTLSGDVGNQTWFAFACDHNASSLCSASSQGSGNNGSPFVVAAAPGGGGGGGSGGTATYGSIKVNITTIDGEGTFNFTASGVSNTYQNFSITTQNNSGSNTQNNVLTGTYAATQATPQGWVKTQDTCSTIIVNTNQTTTCNITNVKTKSNKGSITVKVVAQGGNDTFNFKANGKDYKDFKITTQSGTGSDTQVNLDPKNKYSVSENLPNDWVQDSFTCDAGSTKNNIVVVAGQTTTCTLTATKKNPKPSITSINPNSLVIGSAAFQMTITGKDFIPSSKVRLGGQDRTTTYISSTSLKANIPASDMTTSGQKKITVNNPTPGGGTSNQVNFTVTSSNPVPTITSISPNTKAQNSTQFTMTVNGTNFINSSKVRFEGSDRTTTYVSATKLTAVIRASDLTQANTSKITVFNPTPGGGTSNWSNFTVTPPPPSNLIINVNAEGGDDVFAYRVTGPTSSSVNLVSIVSLNGQGSFTIKSPAVGQYSIEQLINESWQVNSASCITDNGSRTGTFNTNTVSKASIQASKTTNCTFDVEKIEVPTVDGDPIDGGGIDFVGGGTGGGVDGFVVGGFGGGGGGGTSGGGSSGGPGVSPGVSPIDVAIDVIVDNPVIAPIIEIIEPIVATVGDIIEQTEPIVQYAKEVVETPAVATVTKVVTTAGVAVTAAAVTSPSFRFSDIFLIPIRLWGLLLTFLGIKRKSKAWGTVYDSVTKQPLDPAYVTLKSTKGKKVSSSITDIDGRYGFLVDQAGNYKISADKTNYVFPSQKISGTKDEVYDNLYFGEPLDLKKGEVITRNIPLDQVNFDWNEFAKRDKNFMRFYSKWDMAIRQISDPSFVVGFTVSILLLLLAPQPYNFAIFICYILLILMRMTAKALGFEPKAVGYITEKATGDPLSFALIKVMLPSTNTQIAEKVADQYGRYYCLVPKGKYQVKIEKKNKDGSYTEVYTSEVIDASGKGIIKNKFQV